MSSSEKMRAIEIKTPGGPEELAVTQTTKPYAYPGQVLIKVKAAGINRPDILQRKGLYPAPDGASPLPGLEVSGIVEAIGRTTDQTPTSLQVGDEVIALTNGGGYAEYVSVPWGQVLPKPKGWSFAEAATIPETFFTIQQTLIDRGKPTAEDWVLVHGGSGGIGATAIQLAKLAGAKVLTTASTDEKLSYCKEMGADVTINYMTEDFVERTKAETGTGANIIVDFIGGDYVDRNLRAAAPDGTIIQLANLAGREATVTMGLVVAKRLTLFGSTLRAQPDDVKARIGHNLMEQVLPAIENGTIKKPKLKTFPMEDAPKAHEAMDAQDHIGKIVLEMGT
ncbi:NAD(P)H-quinone oxidoreductase [Maritalea mediterranea]|uniref:NAD(P)H-quinone oxidoreductase n=1 Tax=Maritalea mediterranea TaxID=2909667 RepID=A0ABS9ECM3_9HYPH|nr:NAD(P)H-quinone oxidoreductase [Maritalea mediterranea]MCF4099644.1 NAD(P)H-quinone oxidoreductase [Maritalea mediterranea]